MSALSALYPEAFWSSAAMLCRASNCHSSRIRCPRDFAAAPAARLRGRSWRSPDKCWLADDGHSMDAGQRRPAATLAALIHPQVSNEGRIYVVWVPGEGL